MITIEFYADNEKTEGQIKVGNRTESINIKNNSDDYTQRSFNAISAIPDMVASMMSKKVS